MILWKQTRGCEPFVRLLQIGDRIVSICGTSAEGMSHAQAVTLLKSATGTIQLQVSATASGVQDVVCLSTQQWTVT